MDNDFTLNGDEPEASSNGDEPEAPSNPTADKVRTSRDRLAKNLAPLEDLARRDLGYTAMVARGMNSAMTAAFNGLIDDIHGVEPDAVPQAPSRDETSDVDADGKPAAHMIGDASTVEGSRNEMADSKPTNPIEQAQLTAELHPDLDIPAPAAGVSQVVSPIVEVTAPQSLPIPTPSTKGSDTPIPLAMPAVGQMLAPGTETAHDPQVEDTTPSTIVVVPQPVPNNGAAAETVDEAPTQSTDPDAPNYVAPSEAVEAERLF